VYFPLYALTWLTGLYLTHQWAFSNANPERWEQKIPMATLSSTVVWAFLAMQGVVETTTNTGNEVTIVVGSIQLVTGGLALLSGGAFTLWYFDEYPPTEYEIDPQEENPTKIKG
jgi:hypothetical protein